MKWGILFCVGLCLLTVQPLWSQNKEQDTVRVRVLEKTLEKTLDKPLEKLLDNSFQQLPNRNALMPRNGALLPGALPVLGRSTSLGRQPSSNFLYSDYNRGSQAEIIGEWDAERSNREAARSAMESIQRNLAATSGSNFITRLIKSGNGWGRFLGYALGIFNAGAQSQLERNANTSPGMQNPMAPFLPVGGRPDSSPIQ